MPTRHVSFLDDVPPPLRAGLGQLREALGVPDEFPDDVLAAADEAARAPVLPDRDLTSIPFVTIDPEGSTDLDQAVHLETEGEGFLVRYAIADVAAFVAPGGPIDAEAHDRVETLYAPNRRTPLHPEVLSEGATSLLPDQVRPALVWELHLDADGEVTSASVARARVKSVAKLSYAGVQQALDAGTAEPSLVLLRQVGRLREARERARGGISLNLPEQEVSVHGTTWALEYRTPLPVEGWNAQISLMTGMAAATIMLEGGIGILRTLPPAEDHAVARLRRTAQALGISWPASMSYPDFVRSLDPAEGRQAAMLNACASLFRGAGYDAFVDGAPSGAVHAALAANYAHVTAPLRRLVDRYAGEICVGLCAGTAVPEWVLAALDDLPTEMEESDRRSRKYERGIVDLVEAMVLSPRIGQEFTGLLIDVEPSRDQGKLQLEAPAVEARVYGRRLRLGDSVEATLVAANLIEGRVEFRVLRD